MVDVALHLERWPSHSNSWSKQRTGDQVVGGGWSFQEMGVSKPFKQVYVSNKQVSKSFEWADVSNNRLQSHSNSWQRACKQKAVRVLFWREVTFISSQIQFNRINNKECQSYLTGQWCCEMRMWQGPTCSCSCVHSSIHTYIHTYIHAHVFIW